jgi:hypothetical protein
MCQTSSCKPSSDYATTGPTLTKSASLSNGGQFEFLPVTLVKGEVALKAILRVGMHAGFDLGSDSFKPTGVEGIVADVLPQIEQIFNYSAGMDVGVYAHVAEFLTNVTGGAALAAQDHGCDLKIVEEYTLGVGATAGATLRIADHTWGHQPKTTVPIFYTTLADVCAAHAKATSTATSTTSASTATSTGAARRQAAGDLTTTTITTTALFTGVSCASSTIPAALCPQSLQTTAIQTSTLTLVTAVAPGVTPTFPATTATTVPATSAFGKAANSLAATSGAPTSFVPPPPPKSSSAGTGTASANPSATSGILGDVGNFLNGETDGVSNKLIIGLAVGLGLPLVIALISLAT